MTQTKPTPAYYNRLLRDGFRHEIGKHNIALITTKPGAERKPIYAEIRALKKLMSRMDKMAS